MRHSVDPTASWRKGKGACPQITQMHADGFLLEFYLRQSTSSAGKLRWVGGSRIEDRVSDHSAAPVAVELR
jgi:hypothetical protein